MPVHTPRAACVHAACCVQGSGTVSALHIARNDIRAKGGLAVASMLKACRSVRREYSEYPVGEYSEYPVGRVSRARMGAHSTALAGRESTRSTNCEYSEYPL
jgi:hypothetical protein